MRNCVRLYAKTYRWLKIKIKLLGILGYEIYGAPFQFLDGSRWTVYLERRNKRNK